MTEFWVLVFRSAKGQSANRQNTAIATPTAAATQDSQCLI